MSGSLDLLAQSVGYFLNLYLILLFIRVLLTWFPIDWMSPPFSWLSQITDPYLNIFRSFIPPLGGIDLSPMLATFVLIFVSQLVNTLVSRATFASF